MPRFQLFVLAACLLLVGCSASKVATDTITKPTLPTADWANHARFAKANSELANPDPSAAPRVVFMGNSITEGWLREVPEWWAAHPTWINRGISGQTTEQMLVRFRPDVLSLKPAVVVLHAGINDFASNTGPMTPEETFGNLLSMVQLAQANGIKPVLASLPEATNFYWRPAAGNRRAEVAALNAKLRAFAASQNIPYADYHAALSDANGDQRSDYAPDSVHPTPAGYAAMAPVIEEAVAAALR